MDQLCSLAGRYGLKVIEDATESLGSRMTTGRFKGRASGTIGEFGVFSFNGNKIITTGGGGLITARQTRQLDRAKYLSTQAKDDAVRYIHNEVGYNLRMTNLEAALGLAQLEQLDGFIRVKARNYRRYASRLSDVPGLRLLTPPPYAEWNHWFYSLETDPKVLPLDRDGLMEALKSKAIQTRPLWYPNHLQKPYRRNQVWRIERAMTAWKRILNLPCSSGLRTEDVDRVCGVILKAVKK
jgi:perosamine synthetase